MGACLLTPPGYSLASPPLPLPGIKAETPRQARSAGQPPALLVKRDATLDWHPVELSTPPPRGQVASHRALAPDWHAVLEALRSMHWKSATGLCHRENDYDAKRQRIAHSALAKCGQKATVEWSPMAERYRVRADRCGLAICPTCSARKSAALGRRVEHWIGRVQPHRWRMITLSLPSNNDSLTLSRDTLSHAFHKLKQTKCWGSAQHYGYSFGEVTFNVTTRQWHPHLHILMFGVYLPWKALHAAWCKASGVKAACWIDEIDSGGAAARYVAKYVGKPVKLVRNKTADELRRDAGKRGSTVIALEGARLKDLPGEKLEEWIIAVHGRRWLNKVGDGPSLPDEDDLPNEDEEITDWEHVGSLASLLADASAGNEKAQRICQALEVTWESPP
jgi:Replication protein